MLPNEGPLPADIAGPADARPIVFLHSVQLTRKMWLPQVEALSSEYRLIAPDLPGHGALAGVPLRRRWRESRASLTGRPGGVRWWSVCPWVDT